jgi:hypothetical protein
MHPDYGHFFIIGMPPLEAAEALRTEGEGSPF